MRNWSWIYHKAVERLEDGLFFPVEKKWWAQSKATNLLVLSRFEKRDRIEELGRGAKIMRVFNHRTRTFLGGVGEWIMFSVFYYYHESQSPPDPGTQNT